MPGKVLIIDDIAVNRIVLTVKLSSAGYRVVQATGAFDGLVAMRRERPDLVLASARLEGMTPQVFLSRASAVRGAPPAFAAEYPPVHPPVIMLMEGYNQKDRLALLQAGATDVMCHPPKVAALLSRFRAVLRGTDSSQDTLLTEQMAQSLGFSEAPAPFTAPTRVALVARRASDTAGWQSALEDRASLTVLPGTYEHMLGRASAPVSAPDVTVVNLQHSAPEDGLRLIADLRAHPATRDGGIIALMDRPDQTLYCDALDKGADDVLPHGFCAAELELRVARLARRKQASERRRAQMEEGLRAAVTDPLTGLYNRRFAELHLSRVLGACNAPTGDRAQRSARDCAVLAIDIDHFKRINDLHGHQTGDAALSALATLLGNHVRPDDLVARIGGEEFMIILPNTTAPEAYATAQRLCDVVAQYAFVLPTTDQPFKLTVSIGAALAGGCTDTSALMSSADAALYRSKNEGRNQVTMSARSAA